MANGKMSQSEMDGEDLVGPDDVQGDGSPADADTARQSSEEPDRAALLEAERDDLRDKLMRTLADMENLRRRTERDVADARTYAVTAFARDLLTTADNVRRALDSVPSKESQAEDQAGTAVALKSLVEGVELTERDLLKTLERHGVRRLEPEGSKFDPNMHQAMFELANPDVPAGTVVQVLQTGYAIGERVLRPAMVGRRQGRPEGDRAGRNRLAGRHGLLALDDAVGDSPKAGQHGVALFGVHDADDAQVAVPLEPDRLHDDDGFLGNAVLGLRRRSRASRIRPDESLVNVRSRSRSGPCWRSAPSGQRNRDRSAPESRPGTARRSGSAARPRGRRPWVRP
jgi:molecular chaperone GrpE